MSGFEQAWADIYWTFADEDMAFDYRPSYVKQRYMTMRHGVIDFERMTFEWT